MSTVTITIPAAPVAVAPVPGDAAALRDFAADLLTVSSGLDDLATFAGDVLSGEHWEGEAAEAYRRAAVGTADDADDRSLVLRKVSGQVEDYATGLADRKRRRDGLVERRSTLLSRREDLTADVRAAVDVSDEAIQTLQERAEQLRLDVEAFDRDHADLQQDCRTADEQIAQKLQAVDSSAEVTRAAVGLVDPADALLDRPGAPGTDGATPASVHDWWTSLDASQQQALIAAHPQIIGNTDGIPTAARDEANRISLALDLDRLETREDDGGSLTFAERRHLERAQAAQTALDDVAARRDPVTNEPLEGFLSLYDPTAFGGDGAVAVSVGNPDTAQNVSVSVPGMLNDGASIEGGTESVGNLYATARLANPGQSVASTMWIGYDAPSNFGVHGLDTLQVIDEGLADAGGERLADFLDGMREVRDEDVHGRAHLTVIGHSYGSTTVGNAATDHGIPADDVVLIGSPGAGHAADHATDLGLPADHVWAGSASEDAVSHLARNGWVGTGLGLDPTDEDFGAQRFQAENVARGTHDWIWDHNQYYQPNTESLYNMGQIVAGNDDAVLDAEHRHDPWYGPMQDPEEDRQPARRDTGFEP
ncbi:alpha/beta hydrolase [uncultured Aeromicrobium sp.]|jgi:pimeloyl-ACP methyl ester carboxylesterase|uniref:alpha/beta hydrolase n=1 Tax=uncultured Aeromicrobium sp. TaxID=337820 RepID=UPI000A681E77|nr:alpha/beta hydrolase [uncultured Aeromicrobium sp.]